MSRPPNMKINAEKDHGLIVWGRLSSKNEAWAGIVVSTKKLELLFEEKENYTWVFWVHHETFSHLKNHFISDFVKNLERYSKNIKPPRKNNVIEAIKLLFQQYEIKAPTNIFKKNALLPKVKTDIEKMTFNRIAKSSRHHSWFISGRIIEVMKNVNAKNIHKTVTKNIKMVYQHTSSKSKFCIACRSSADEMKHPIFSGFLCDNCFSKGKAVDSLLAIATDGSNTACGICLRNIEDLSISLKLVLCNFCVRSYCTECLGLYCGDYYLDVILKATSWKCIACNNSSSSTCALRKRNVKEQLNNVYNLFPAVEKLCIDQTKVKAREICALTSEDVMVSQILGPYEFPFKFLHYKYDDEVEFKFKEYELEFSQFKHELGKLDHQHVAKLLIECYSDTEEYSDTFGTMKSFFDFYKLKCLIENFGPCFFWAFESSASITAGEQEIITRFLGKRPILIGTNTADVRQRGRFIWTNITILASSVQAFRKYNIFLADIKSDEKDVDADEEDEKPVLYNSLYTILNSLLKNDLELEI